jgi:aspartokinase
MALPARLGGFKILKDVGWTSITPPIGTKGLAGDICKQLSKEKINLSLLTCGSSHTFPSVRLAVEAPYARKAVEIVKTRFPDAIPEQSDVGILSIFPHRNNPAITGALLQVLVQKEIPPVALLNSPSAISIVLARDHVDRTAAALFEPFRFSAYQTPADWKLAQKGKEDLYKEVVASYQEKKPKVYALEWYGEQILVQAKLSFADLAVIGEIFAELAPLKALLTFFALSPEYDTDLYSLLFCLPASAVNHAEFIDKRLSTKAKIHLKPVAFFSMNGPHFGDRYGIAENLYSALIQSGVQVLGLNCSIASVSGIVAAEQIQMAIRAIKVSFDVPTIIRRD